MEILLLRGFIRRKVVQSAVFAEGRDVRFLYPCCPVRTVALRPARRRPARPALWLGFCRGGAWVGVYADALIAFWGVDLSSHPLFPSCRFV